MRIGELAFKFDIQTSSLRYYERQGLLPPPSRIAGQRSYDDLAVRRVAFIRSAKDSGLTLREIKAMIAEGNAGIAPRRLWRQAASEKFAVIDRKIAALQNGRSLLQKKLSCRCRTLAQCERMLTAERNLRTRQARGAK